MLCVDLDPRPATERSRGRHEAAALENVFGVAASVPLPQRIGRAPLRHVRNLL